MRRYKSNRPLTKVRNEWLWKGYRLNDDLFNELMDKNPKERQEYNNVIRKLRRKGRKTPRYYQDYSSLSIRTIITLIGIGLIIVILWNYWKGS